MGKRSKFPRIPKDLYRTFDKRALPPLLPHLPKRFSYVECCAGHGDLTDQLDAAGFDCAGAYDIDPGREGITQADALSLRPNVEFDFFLTNPPWTRSILHPLIVHLSDQKPTWLLFDANWAHTKQAAPFQERCRRIVSVGRLLWIPGTKMQGKDDVAWYLFDKPIPGSGPRFFGRGVLPREVDRRTRRVCTDCGVLIDRFAKWWLQPRNGVPSPVHRDCARPSGPDATEEPMAIMDWIGSGRQA